MDNYIFLTIVGVLIVILLSFTVYMTITEKFSPEGYQNYDNSQDIFMRRSIDLDLLEDDTYLMNDYNFVVNTDNIKEFKYLGPAWKDEFNYSNPEVLKVEYQRDKLLEFIKEFECDSDYKTFPSSNNTTFCGGTANRCNTAGDCCGGKNCFNGKCSF